MIQMHVLRYFANVTIDSFSVILTTILKIWI